MNELLNINNDTQRVSARELHAVLEATERYSTWFDRFSVGFVEGEDYTTVNKLTEVQNNGGIQVRELVDHECSIDMAKHICLMSRTEKGKECRQYLINLEKAWNTPEQVMARALKVADQTIKGLEADVKRMRPKEIFADAVVASESSILVRELAKLLKQNGKDIGEKRLYKWMREHGYICRNTTEPTQKAMELGLFERLIRTVERGDGLPKETITTKVTAKGQMYFINKLLGKSKGKHE